MVTLSLNIGDRVTKDGSFGTVEGIFGQYVWVLPDQGTVPMTFPEGDLIYVPPTPPTFEVGKTYKVKDAQPPFDTYKVIYDIDGYQFIVLATYAVGGIGATIVIAPQRAAAEEV